MEFRIWIPTTWAGWRYCLRRPRYFLIGRYGFRRWREEYLRASRATAQLADEQEAHRTTKARLELTRRERDAARLLLN